VSAIRRWLPEVGLSNVRLRPGPGDALEVEQPGGRTDKHGQFLFAVDGSEQSPDDLFARAQSAEQSGDIVEAERLYRLLIKSDPTDASAPFNLGNMLRAHAHHIEAEAAFRSATRTDPSPSPHARLVRMSVDLASLFCLDGDRSPACKSGRRDGRWGMAAGPGSTGWKTSPIIAGLDS
jgi:hypothetical protein